MATSVDDLLNEAEAQVWELGRRAPTTGGVAELREADRALRAAWPEFARQADRLLGAAGMPPAQREGAWTLLDRQPVRDHEPDAHLRRAAHVLGAAADLLTGGRVTWLPREQDDVAALRDRVCAVVEAAARLGAAHAAAAGSTRHTWQSQVEAMDAVVSHMRAQRSGGPRPSAVADVAAVSAGERTLDGEVARWRAVAHVSVQAEAIAASSVGARMVMVDLAVLSRVAGELVAGGNHDVGPARGAVEAVKEAASRWEQAVTMWPRWMSSGGVSVEQVDASRRLREVVGPLLGVGEVAGDAPAYPAGNRAVSVARRMLVDVEVLGRDMAAGVERVIDSGMMGSPARRIVQEVRRSHPHIDDSASVIDNDLADAAVRGRGWAVPADLAVAREVILAARAGRDASRDARVFADATFHVLAHPVAARQVHRAGTMASSRSRALPRDSAMGPDIGL